VGPWKGGGRSSQQPCIAPSSKVGFAKLSDRKTSRTAADLLTEQGGPVCDPHAVPLSRIWTARGTESCGSPATHESERYWAVETIEHPRPKVQSPPTTGSVERLHQTMLPECSRLTFRKKSYCTLAELQVDLDQGRTEYHEERVHQGRGC
jgi:hypothetical protein